MLQQSPQNWIHEWIQKFRSNRSQNVYVSITLLFRHFAKPKIYASSSSKITPTVRSSEACMAFTLFNILHPTTGLDLFHHFMKAKHRAHSPSETTWVVQSKGTWSVFILSYDWRLTPLTVHQALKASGFHCFTNGNYLASLGYEIVPTIGSFLRYSPFSIIQLGNWLAKETNVSIFYSSNNFHGIHFRSAMCNWQLAFSSAV